MEDEGWDEEEILEIISEMDAGGYHAMPHGDIAPHTESVACWCQPTLIYRNVKDQKEVWAHRFAMENPN